MVPSRRYSLSSSSTGGGGGGGGRGNPSTELGPWRGKEVGAERGEDKRGAVKAWRNCFG